MGVKPYEVMPMDHMSFTRGERIPFSEVYLGSMFYWGDKLYIRTPESCQHNARAVDPTEESLVLGPATTVQLALLEEIKVARVLPPFSRFELRNALIGMSSHTVSGNEMRDRLVTLLNDYAANLVNQQRMYERSETAAASEYEKHAHKQYFAIVTLADLLQIESARLELLTKQVVERLRASL